MGPLPPLLLHEGTISTTTPLIDPLQAGMSTHSSRQTPSGSGAVGVGSALAGIIPHSPQLELGEGSNRSADARNLKLWQ